MNKQSEDKATITTNPDKPIMAELGEQDLEKITGGTKPTVTWSHDDESPKETVTFEYGALVIK
jgi:hypothetical protein